MATGLSSNRRKHMSYEDKTLNCVQCRKEFVFSAGEQAFYDEKGFSSPPKRCKACRKARREGSPTESTGYGIYRSPSFEGSAPDHQKIRPRNRRGRGRRGGRRGGGRGDNRSRPARGRSAKKAGGEYRSPGFKSQPLSSENEYRAPGFREIQDRNFEEEYRAPGFGEYQNIKPDEEYRAPGYHDDRRKWMDEKPLFSIICSACGQEAMVPFLPEEKDNPMCPDCYQLHKRMMAEDAAAEEAERSAAVEEPPPAADEEPAAEEPESSPDDEQEPSEE
jgi:CxxC-x17-CxxC domain-containing protein